MFARDVTVHRARVTVHGKCGHNVDYSFFDMQLFQMRGNVLTLRMADGQDVKIALDSHAAAVDVTKRLLHSKYKLYSEIYLCPVHEPRSDTECVICLESRMECTERMVQMSCCGCNIHSECFADLFVAGHLQFQSAFCNPKSQSAAHSCPCCRTRHVAVLSSKSPDTNY